MNAKETANGGGPLLCSTCRWWFRLDDHGECRRHPPTVVPIFSEAMSSWPITNHEEWCGDWQPVGRPVLVSGGDDAA